MNFGTANCTQYYAQYCTVYPDLIFVNKYFVLSLRISVYQTEGINSDPLVVVHRSSRTEAVKKTRQCKKNLLRELALSLMIRQSTLINLLLFVP